MRAFAKTLASLDAWIILLICLIIMAALYVAFTKIPKTRPYKGQLLVLSGICLMALLFFILTYSFKVSKMATGATAATMPRAWCGCLIPVALLCLKSILDGSSEPDEAFGPHWKMVIGVVVAVFVSVYLFSSIGYYLSSAIFVILLMWLMGERRPLVLVGVPIGWCIFTYFVFAKFLFIALPTGTLWASIF
ncbi:MAG: tripartite tricarboxylate transporter TctB family protein [Brotaphodocola sp.]